MSTRTITLTTTTLAASCLAIGCASAPALHPAPRADKVLGLEAAAEESDSQTQIIVQAAEWPGDAQIDDEVTPLQVTIHNRGGDPLRISYDAFVLQGSRDTYAALPPFKIDGSVPTDERIASTHWAHTGFAPAPYYGAYSSDVTLYNGAFTTDPMYYRTYYPRWTAYEALPTEEMLAWALPEGVVEPGGSVTGYLYFEQVDEDENEVQFRAHLDSDTSGMEVVNVSIPFMVVE